MTSSSSCRHYTSFFVSPTAASFQVTVSTGCLLPFIVLGSSFVIAKYNSCVTGNFASKIGFISTVHLSFVLSSFNSIFPLGISTIWLSMVEMSIMLISSLITCFLLVNNCLFGDRPTMTTNGLGFGAGRGNTNVRAGVNA